jgi:hypothetical protein
MMPQMDAGDPREQPGSSYGRYEGSQSYAQQQQSYDTPYSPPQASAYDDDFVDGLAQRLSQRMGQIPQGKVFPGAGKQNKADAGQRLGLAIVSVGALIPISIVLLQSAGFFGLIGLVIACVAIILINAIFNGTLG